MNPIIKLQVNKMIKSPRHLIGRENVCFNSKYVMSDTGSGSFAVNNFELAVRGAAA